jgi:Zn-dependent protease with chaperone function
MKPLGSTPSSAHPGADKSVLDSFTADIKPTRVSLLYKAGLAVVAFAMILLPAIYLALIALAIWLVYLHLAHNTGLLTGRGHGLWRLLIYAGPALAGGILVFFMVKPFFAKRVKENEPFTLKPEDEKVLFPFIEHICRLVRAPKPCRVDVDMQVNASASLRRGLLSNDLVLTIGLPLVAGLNAREFGGVLAHEFGHFAQGAGMRLTYIVRHINMWFARVVYERDEWDIKLEHAARGSDVRIGIILHTARGCVWLTRRILWALMHAGNAISCFMLRQMEFDADSYEAKVAGSDAFESTSFQLRTLNVAAQIAYEDVRQSWASKRLPENIPLLVQHKGQTLPDIQAKLRESADTQKTGWFDTHPSDRERVQAARQLNEPGVFRVERPAAELFAKFHELSSRLTRHHHEKQLELETADANFVSADEMLRESAESAQIDIAVRKFYGNVLAIHVPLFTGAPSVDGNQDLGAIKVAWQKACDTAAHYRSAAEEWSKFSSEHQQKLTDCTTAHHLLEAGFQITAKDFGLPESATSAGEQQTVLKQRLPEIDGALAEASTELQHFVGATGERVLASIESLRRPEVQAAVSDGINLQAEAEVLLKVYGSVGATLPALHDLNRKVRAFVMLAQNRNNHSAPERVDAEINSLVRGLRELVARIQSKLEGLRYPFRHARGEISIIEYARYGKQDEAEWETVYHDANAHLERLFALHYRALGRLLVIADVAEQGWPAVAAQNVAA